MSVKTNHFILKKHKNKYLTHYIKYNVLRSGKIFRLKQFLWYTYNEQEEHFQIGNDDHLKFKKYDF